MRAYRSWIRRAIITAVALGVWFWTQSLIGNRTTGSVGVGDGIHDLTAPLHAYLAAHPAAADALLITSSGLIDLLGIFLIASAIFGRSLRPLIALLLVFGLRQACQLTCVLPPPPDMIWRDPGFPTLLVTYGVSNDLFFSGHTAISILGALELAQLGKLWYRIAGIAVACFEIVTVLVLRAHYTMDVFTAIFVALAVFAAARTWSVPIDQWLDRRTAARDQAGSHA